MAEQADDLVRFGVASKDGMIHMVFDRPCEVLSMTPKQAQETGMALLRLSVNVEKEARIVQPPSRKRRRKPKAP